MVDEKGFDWSTMECKLSSCLDSLEDCIWLMRHDPTDPETQRLFLFMLKAIPHQMQLANHLAELAIKNASDGAQQQETGNAS